MVATYYAIQHGSSWLSSLECIGETSGRPATITTWKAEAYTSIDKAVYSGHSDCYTFEMYVSTHLTCHHELEIHGEPLSESKRPLIFLAGITAPSLLTAKENVTSDVTKLEKF
jgi:hypothetical protein